MIEDKYIHLINLKNINFNNKILISWLKYNEEWKCIKWNSKMIENLLKLKYKKIYNYYIKVDDIKKKDIASFLILYHYGGLYLNLSLICTKSINKLIKYFKNYDIILSKYPKNNLVENMYFKLNGIKDTSNIISNDIILSKKKKIFWLNLVNKIIEKPIYIQRNNHTGYVFMSNFIYENKKTKFLNDIILANNYFLIPCYNASFICNNNLSYTKLDNDKINYNFTYYYFRYLRNLKKILLIIIYIIIVFYINKI